MAEVLHFPFNCFLSVSSTRQHLHLSQGRSAGPQSPASAVKQEPPNPPHCAAASLRPGLPAKAVALPWGPAPRPLQPPTHLAALCSARGHVSEEGLLACLVSSMAGMPWRTPVPPGTWLSPVPPHCLRLLSATGRGGFPSCRGRSWHGRVGVFLNRNRGRVEQRCQRLDGSWG